MSYGLDAYGGESYAGSLFQGGATFPSLDVQFAFTTAPLASEPVWVSVAEDVRDVSTTRGRQQELDRYQAGTCTVTLSNADRRYDPRYTGSPHNGYIKPMRRMRVLATFAGVTYPIFDGFVDSWDQDYLGPNDAVAVVSATDGFKILNRAKLASSAYAQEVIADDPLAWWRLAEPDTQNTAFDSSGNGHNAEYLDSPGRGEAGLVSREPGSSAEFIHSNANRVEYDGRIVTDFSFTIEAVIKIPTPSDVDYRVIYDEEWHSAANVGGHALFVDDNFFGNPGRLTWESFDITGTRWAIYSTSRVDDGLVHHVAMTYDGSGRPVLYVDGVNQTNERVTSAISLSANDYQYKIGIGNLPSFSTDVGQFGLGGYLQEVAVYDTALSPERIAAHAAQVSTPWNNDTVDERIERVLDVVSWPENLRDLDASDTELQPASLGTSALEHAQKAAESDFGELFVTADGKVRFIERHALLNRDEMAVFGDGPGELGYRTLQPQFSDALVRNPITVSRVDGVAQTVEDEDGVEEYGPQEYTRDGLLHGDDDLSRSAAYFLLSEYKDPKFRISGLVVGPPPPGSEADLYPQMLGRELGDEITLIQRPQGVGSETQDSRIEGIQHTVTPKSWVTSWNLSPAYVDAFWQIGVPGFSEIGLTTKVGF